MFSSFFNSKASASKSISVLGYSTEVHNHLLYGIDDGVKTLEEGLELIEAYIQMGIKKIITTPHIKTEVYDNSSETIFPKLEELRKAIEEKDLPLKIEAAAEYYLDEVFLGKIKANEPILTFGEKYLLFETSHVDESPLFTEAAFLLRLQGYKPIFAHPERYQYAFNNFALLERLYDSGVFFQLNINSLNGYYGKEAQKQAKLLVEKGMVDFLGTDAHGMRHIETLPKSIETKEYQKLINSGKILNNTL